MKKNDLLDFRNFVILFLVIVAVLGYFNVGGLLPNRVEYYTTTDSIPYPVHDTIPYEVLVEVPYEVEVEVPVNVIQQVDTSKILEIYYLRNEVSEVLTLPNDVGSVTLSEVISENKVVERKLVDPKLKKQIQYDTLRIPEEPKTKFYYGLNFSANREDFVNSLGVGMMMKTKTDKIYRIDLGLNNRVFDGNVGKLAPYLGGGVYWKIGSKNNRF
jgi:hypothetical protein